MHQDSRASIAIKAYSLLFVGHLVELLNDHTNPDSMIKLFCETPTKLAFFGVRVQLPEWYVPSPFNGVDGPPVPFGLAHNHVCWTS